MDLKDFLWPSCHLCRELRAALSVAASIVLAVYAIQLWIINIEMNLKEKGH